MCLGVAERQMVGSVSEWREAALSGTTVYGAWCPDEDQLYIPSYDRELFPELYPYPDLPSCIHYLRPADPHPDSDLMLVPQGDPLSSSPSSGGTPSFVDAAASVPPSGSLKQTTLNKHFRKQSAFNKADRPSLSTSTAAALNAKQSSTPSITIKKKKKKKKMTTIRHAPPSSEPLLPELPVPYPRSPLLPNPLSHHPLFLFTSSPPHRVPYSFGEQDVEPADVPTKRQKKSDEAGVSKKKKGKLGVIGKSASAVLPPPSPALPSEVSVEKTGDVSIGKKKNKRGPRTKDDKSTGPALKSLKHAKHDKGSKKSPKTSATPRQAKGSLFPPLPELLPSWLRGRPPHLPPWAIRSSATSRQRSGNERERESGAGCSASGMDSGGGAYA
jgi:hypothetical protein